MSIAEADLEKKKTEVKTETKEQETSKPIKTFDKFLVKTLYHQLELQQDKCGNLQTALSMQKSKSKKILDDLTTQHETQIVELERVIKNFHENLQNQSKKHGELVNKLLLSNNVIDELMAENEKLEFQLSLKMSCVNP